MTEQTDKIPTDPTADKPAGGKAPSIAASVAAFINKHWSATVGITPSSAAQADKAANERKRKGRYEC
jgi:hypothetical protein